MLNPKIIALRGEGKTPEEIGRLLGLPTVEVEFQIRHPGCSHHVSDETRAKISNTLKTLYDVPDKEGRRRYLPPKKGYKGVSTLYGVRWMANIMLNNKKKSLGIFDSPEEAALAYNEGVDAYYDGNGYKNVLGDDAIAIVRQNDLNKPKKVKKEPTKPVEYRHKPPKGTYKGVYTYGPKWQAQIRLNNKQKFLGLFDTPELAAVAYNKALDEYYGGDGWKNPV